MSHEIRTPMNGVLAMAAMALDSELTSEQRDCLTTVQSSAESLRKFLNDIRDFSKIESRKLELEAIPFSGRHAGQGSACSEAAPPEGTMLEALARNWGWLLFRAVLAVSYGLAVFGWPDITLDGFVYVFGPTRSSTR